MTYASGLLGLILLVILGLHADLGAMLQAVRTAGWPLLALVPWRLIFLVLYALGWRVLLAHRDPGHGAGTAYLVWVTAVREAADRLLPLPTIGGGLIGLRLLKQRGLAAAPVAASILAEMLLTFAATYVFAGLALFLLFDGHAQAGDARHIGLLFVLSLAVPVSAFLALRSGAVFTRLQRILGGAFAGLVAGISRMDSELRTILASTPQLALSGGLQLLALLTGSMEVWLALRLFGHPVGIGPALIMEGLTQAVRNVFFFIPASIGAQEAGLVLFGNALGISPELSLAVSLVKRIREVTCGVPALLSWQYLEGRRIHRPGGPR